MNNFDEEIKTNGKVSLEVIESSTFPQNVLHFSEYNGSKTFVTFLFFLCLAYFIAFFIPEGKSWWGHIPILGSMAKSAVNFVVFCWRFLLLTISYCLLWFTFDRRGFSGFAMGAFSFIFGLVYIISPVDFVPDVLPIIGGLDDAAIGGISMFLGIKNWFQATEQKRTHLMVIEKLRNGDKEGSLQLLLEERGIFFKNLP